MAERHAAIHAARALVAQDTLLGQPEVLVVVTHALLRVALLEADPLESQETAELSHQVALFAGVGASTGRVGACGAAAA